MTETEEEPHVSPSQQVHYIHGCARFWAFSYIHGLKERTGPAADRGHKVHKVLEDWQMFATPPDLTSLYGRIAKPAIKYTPPPMSPGVFPEKNVLWRSPRGNLFNFLKDLEYPEGPIAYIWDYKSTSNLSYAHTTEELLETDPQGITYPAHRFIVSPEVNEVKCAWLYLPANPPHYCHPVYAIHERKPCLERFDLLDKTAGYMLEHRRKKTNPLAFAPNPAHCRAFNRECPFTDRCNLSDLEQMIAMTAANSGPLSMHFLASIQRNAAGPGPTPGEGAPKQYSAAPAVPAQGAFALANLGGSPAPAAPPPPVFTPPPPVFTPPPQQPVAPVAPVFSSPAMPQSAPLPWQTQAPAPVAPPPPAFAAPAPTAFTPPVAPAVPGQLAWPPPSATVTETAAAEPPAAKKKGRRTKAEIEAAKAESNILLSDENFVAQPREEESAEAYESRVIAQTLEVPAADTLLLRVSLAMASNPGYCTLDSTAFAARARSIAAAVQNEENDL